MRIAAPSLDRAAWMRLADYCAAGVAVTLPWSTSATSVAIVLWIVSLVPALDWRAVRREAATWAGGLPVAFAALGVLGMAWADVDFASRANGAESFLRFMLIPALFFHFRHSDNGMWPLAGFLFSTTLLLVASFASAVTPGELWGLAKTYGVPVKDYIAQAGEFTLSGLGSLYLALHAWRSKRAAAAAGWALLGLGFFANILFIVASRTALVTLPVLAAIFVMTQFSGGARTVGMVAAALVTAAILLLSPLARERLGSLSLEVEQRGRQETSAGARLDFWTGAVEIIRQAPLIGHGTGTIGDQYRRVAEQTDTDNPHNQTFAVAIQLGLAGTIVLYAMWLSHLLLFWRHGLPAFAGLIVVAQNTVGCLFNTHLFDFTHGWIYIFGVGIAGGLVRAQQDRARY